MKNKKYPSSGVSNERYITPQIKVISILMDQNILQSSAGGSGESTDMPYNEGWWS